MPSDEYLAHEWLGSFGRITQRRIVGRHSAPAQQRLAFGLNYLFKLGFQTATLVRVARQEHQTAAVFTFSRQLDAGLAGCSSQKLVGHLHQHTRAIAGVHFAAACTTMIKVFQHLDTLLQNPVCLAAFNIGHKADATGIVFELRVIQTLFLRPTQHG